ncbi:defensin beta 136 [Saccopteryx bilineata]|uniref:defensin beta 136 n=1 Tax=Saccopteryx bilineata TaxID=59482 RepID=UPI00338FA078
MRLCLSGSLFLLVISLPAGHCLIENEGVMLRGCTVIGGRCFFACPVGWKWAEYCYSIFSCCKVMEKHKPPQAFQY